MKILIAFLLVAAPAAAQAMGMRGGMHGGGCGSAGAHLAIGLYALLAGLGYWILHHSAKEAAKYVKITGQVLGWALALMGLLGVLCGVASHTKKNCRCSGKTMSEPAAMNEMSSMHPNCPITGAMAGKPEASPKKK